MFRSNLFIQCLQYLVTNSNYLSGDPNPRADHGTTQQTESEIDPSELKRRTEFLKAQRDKLLAMKKAEREKQLEEVEKSQMKSRPKSARAARSAFGGKSTPKIDPKTLEARRALAEKLKAEVIGN